MSLPESRPALWLIGSAVLGVGLSEASLLATAHAGLILLAAAYVGLSSRRIPSVLVVLVYGGLCDVLWRATGARAPWEGSKYIVIFLSVLAVVRLVRQPRRLTGPALVVAGLVPAALMSVVALPLAEAKDDIAFTLLGLVALATGTALCRQLVLTGTELRGLLWWGLSPCVSMGAIAAWGTIKAGSIEFGNESMFATAGGFGPNQVSTVLGLGVLFTIGIVLLGAVGRARILAAMVGAGLLAQALITLSRGGVYALGLAAMALLAAGILLSGNRSRGTVVLIFAGVLAMVALNWAQGFSGGAVENRFNQNDSGRSSIVAAEIDLFRAYPLTGVGAGQAKLKRSAIGALTEEPASHNEYSRLLAEHGLAGLLVIGTLIVMGAQAFLRGGDPVSRSLAVGFVVWSAATMSHSATRTAAFAVVFALASLRVEGDSTSRSSFTRSRR